MASFYEDVLKPYEKNKISLDEFSTGENYRLHTGILKERIAESISSRAFNELTMKFTGHVYVFSENELKELIKSFDR